MKIFILILVLLFSSISVFASGLFSLSKSQQNRLNMIIKQLKVPSGDYKLTVTSTGVILREYEPTIITSTWETIIKEKIVEKIITVEKIVEKPMSLCVDLSKVDYSKMGRDDQYTKIMIEIEEMKKRNSLLWCP